MWLRSVVAFSKIITKVNMSTLASCQMSVFVSVLW